MYGLLYCCGWCGYGCAWSLEYELLLIGRLYINVLGCRYEEYLFVGISVYSAWAGTLSVGYIGTIADGQVRDGHPLDINGAI